MKTIVWPAALSGRTDEAAGLFVEGDIKGGMPGCSGLVYWVMGYVYSGLARKFILIGLKLCKKIRFAHRRRRQARGAFR